MDLVLGTCNIINLEKRQKVPPLNSELLRWEKKMKTFSVGLKPLGFLNITFVTQIHVGNNQDVWFKIHCFSSLLPLVFSSASSPGSETRVPGSNSRTRTRVWWCSGPGPKKTSKTADFEPNISPKVSHFWPFLVILAHLGNYFENYYNEAVNSKFLVFIIISIEV